MKGEKLYSVYVVKGYPHNLGYVYSTLVTAIDGKPCLEQEQTFEQSKMKSGSLDLGSNPEAR